MSITRIVALRVRFKWNGADWVDETARVLAINGALEYQALHEAMASGKHIIQQATIRLANKDHRYSTWHTASVLYPYRTTGGPYQAPCEIAMSVDGNPYQIVFTGYVKSPTENYIKNDVSFTIWDKGEILRKKYSTAMLQNYMEHDVVIYYLQLAGLVDGVDFISPTYASINGGTATIDYASTRIPYSWLDDEPIWDELADLAQASGAQVYVTRDGFVCFRKGYQWATIGAQETVTPDQYNDIEPRFDDKSFYDEVLVEYAERVPGDASDELWKLDRPLLIYPSTTEEIEAKLRYPAITITPPVANTDYFVRNLAGQDKIASITLVLTYAAQKVVIRATNNTGEMAILSKMSIKGQPLLGQPSKQTKGSTGSDNYDREISVRGNPYIQSQVQAEGVKNFLTWWYKTVKMLWKIKGIRGVPTRALGDRITFKIEGQTLYGITTRIEWTIGSIESGGAFGYQQSLDLVEDVFTGEGTFFKVGVSQLGGGDGVWF